MNSSGIINPNNNNNSNLKSELSYEDYIQSLDSDEKNKIKDIFELFDKNLDGGIDIKELKFILNSLDIFPNHDELTAMMFEADRANKGYINENDFLYIIAKQKIDYKNKLTNEAKNAFIALGGRDDLEGTIPTKRIQEILKGEFDLSDDMEKMLKKVSHNKEEIGFEDFIKFFQ